MYSFTITDAIAADLNRFEELRKRFDADSVLVRTWNGRMRRELESAAIGASVSMEGVPVTADEVRRILVGDRPQSVSQTDAALVTGYRDAMGLVLSRADDPHFVWQSELVRSIHRDVMAGSYVSGAGRYREGVVHVVDRATETALYDPPAPDLVPQLVDDLAGWLQGRGDAVPVPVASAVAHVRLAGIHPFRDGNGRTARIVASLVMYRGGYRLPQFTSLEEWWGSHQSDYYSAFACLGGSSSDSADVTPFVEAHVAAQTAQAVALSLRFATERLLWAALEQVAGDATADIRAANALYDAVMLREVTNRYYRAVVDVTAPTAAADLKRLEAAGLLQARGAGRSAHYVGTPGLVRAVADAVGIEVDVRGARQLDGALRDSLMVTLAERARVA